MNEFDKVFNAVKKHCTDDGIINGIDGFKYIAQEEDISLIRLSFYLETLQNLGLITYSISNHHIALTNIGRQQHRLFTE